MSQKVSFWFVSHLASHSFLLVVMLHKILVSKSYASSLGQYFDLIHAFVYFQRNTKDLLCYNMHCHLCFVFIFLLICSYSVFKKTSRVHKWTEPKCVHSKRTDDNQPNGQRTQSCILFFLFFIFVYELCKFICYQSHCVCNTITYMSSRSFGGSRYKNCVYIDTPLTSTVLCDS